MLPELLNHGAENAALFLFSVEIYRNYFSCILMFYYFLVSWVRFSLSTFMDMFEWLLNLSTNSYGTAVGKTRAWPGLLFIICCLLSAVMFLLFPESDSLKLIEDQFSSCSPILAVVYKSFSTNGVSS